MIEYRMEPLSYMLKTGLSSLTQECFDRISDEFYEGLYSPDWQLYKEQEDMKKLAFFSMRDEGKLVGYATIKTLADIHQKGKMLALIHDIYVQDPYRSRAKDFLAFIEQFMYDLGAFSIDVAERLTFRKDKGGVGKFYAFCGFRPMEVVWRKVLKEGN